MTYVAMSVNAINTVPTFGALTNIGAMGIKFQNGEYKFLDSFSVALAYDESRKEEDHISWWENQNTEAQNEVFSWEKDRLVPISAMHSLDRYLKKIQGNETELIMVADYPHEVYPWVDMLYKVNGKEAPFTDVLCVNTMSQYLKSKFTGHHVDGAQHVALYEAQRLAQRFVGLFQ